MSSPVLVTMDRHVLDAIRYPSQNVIALPFIPPPPTARATITAILPPPIPGVSAPVFGASYYQERARARAAARGRARERAGERQRERARRARLEAAPRGEGRLLTPPPDLPAPATVGGTGTQASNVAALVPFFEDVELSDDAFPGSDSDADGDESDYASELERDDELVSSFEASSDEEDSIVEITSEEFHGSFTVVIPAARTFSRSAAANHPYTQFVDESSAEESPSEEDEDTTSEHEQPAARSVARDEEHSEEIDIRDDEFMAHLTATHAELKAELARLGAAVAAHPARKEAEAS